MEASHSDAQQIPDMVMCGDHSSFIKSELNAKDARVENDQEKLVSFPKLSSATSESGPGVGRVRRSQQQLQPQPQPQPQPQHVHVMQAAGNCRWPPYLVCVWVLALLLAHALHALEAMLDRALPFLQKLSEYFRMWAECAWRAGTAGGGPGRRALPLALAAAAAALCALHAVARALHVTAAWLLRPLEPLQPLHHLPLQPLQPLNADDAERVTLTEYIEHVKV